ncbi:rod shape-determining protein MreC [Orenia metallireducens]|uniref:Cell shape-determining protein MreC n=1 Tax=Orenia metallireducens TaxID=1413210 RepID=A0A285HAW1_9FIRM|nr:rod shape-determining protein MreC [Orenia metallireducens]SNY32892.1 rod shape-determining protein MreC [Orenia metallireducens]
MIAVLEFLKEHRKKILIIIFVIVLIRFINLVGRDRDYNRFEGLIIDLLKPGFVVVNSIEEFSKGTFRVILDYKSVKEENEKLKDKVENLNYNLKQIEKIMLENHRLRELLNFKEFAPYKVVGGSVIGHSSENWSNVLVIDRGSKAGIRRKMPVVAKNGYLLGITQQVTAHTAQILLINDGNFVAGGLVQRKDSRDLGVIKGQTQESRLLMNNLAWDADIRVGDTIVTSGSQYYPKGLPIGKVISVSPDNYGLTQAALIAPFIDVRRVEEVLVITDFSTKVDLLEPLNSDHQLEGERE